MYLNDEVHKPENVKGILDAQLTGWIFESHCWHTDGKGNTDYPMICKWCGLKAISDMEIENGRFAICEHNPVLLSSYSKIEEVIENEQVSKGEVSNGS